jgi:hypothetical protein
VIVGFSSLVAYPYATKFLLSEERKRSSTWALDSGAFSAHQSGRVIDLKALTRDALRWREQDAALEDVFALDVIGDPVASRRNAEEMALAGLLVVPTYHYGTPLSELRSLSRDFPKVAIGGAAKLDPAEKIRFAQRCFAAIWPKKIHGLAYAFRTAVMGMPFHSVDSAVWVLQALRFQTIPEYGVCRGASGADLLAIQLSTMMRLEREARSRWKKEMLELESKEDA